MSQIMKTFLGVFLIMFMVVTSSGVLSGFMTVVEAQNLHAQIINELMTARLRRPALKMHQKPEIHWSLNCI